MNAILIMVAMSQPVDATIIRRCFDNLAMQFYVARDASGGLWYGTPAAKASVPWSRLDPKSIDQVCPDAPDGARHPTAKGSSL